MAEKKYKSQAERAAATSAPKAKKRSNVKANVVSPRERNEKKEKQSVTANENRLPVRVITSLVFICLFVLLLVMLFFPDGFVINAIKSVIQGMIGSAGFIAAVPITLYLFVIHAFSGKRPVIMRSVCAGCFLLLVGCLAYMIADYNIIQHFFGEKTFIQLVGQLYTSTSGGVISGLLCMLLTKLFGVVFTYIVLIVAALLTLLASFNITIPSVVRAIQNRPRAEWEDEEEEEEKPEPAAVVVNHIANKRIAYIENQRKIQEAAAAKTDEERASQIIRQIDIDPEMPVAAASDKVPVQVVDEPELIFPEPVAHIPEPEPVVIPEMPKPKKKVEKVPTVVDEDLLDEPFFEETPIPDVPVENTEKVKVTAKDAEESAHQVAVEIAQAEQEVKPAYSFPPIDLLKLPSGGALDGTEEMRENTRRLNETLASFKIEAHIINVTRGPSVTRYEVELEKGVRLSKLTTAADDIALSLGATGVRIAAIPGKISVVGIEVPNRAVTMVSLREVIDSPEFTKAKSKSSFAVGKDIGGNCIIGNISRLPHMLIAGTTGSGKSVCMNSIIISLLYKASPEDVKLIMVDPKMVELGIYNGIPHLLIPVVTDPKKAAGSLQWAVTEMMRRYKAMSDAGVRDLESYNSIMLSQNEPSKKMPQVVVIIDELADLMLVAAKEVEESICRIAQMGRAAGIHLVIATQRPSADVITGLMKANIPSRIAFSVASAMESRIILDTQGAEKLVGKGDMLYAPIGDGKPKRVQGCFVSDPEVEAVAVYVKSLYTTTYDQNVMEEIEKKAQQTGNKPATASDPEPSADELAGDEMLPAAVDVILETGQASVSMLQRRLKLGYARAARIVDEMEELGIVGPFQGSKPRDILVTKEQWETMHSGQKAQMDFDDLAESDIENEE